MIQIIPAVLATSEDQYAKDIKKLEASESFRNGWVHIDFTDNKFVPNKTIGPKEVAKYPTTLKKEAHLMVVYPKALMEELTSAGFDRVFFHMECEDNLNECIDEAREKGLEVGLVLRHETPIKSLEPLAFKVDRVLLMGVAPGFQGQPFIEDSLQKIRQLKSKEWPVKIGIDGAVKDTNIKQIIEAGADYVNIGSFLMKENTDENMEKLWEAING